MVGISWLINVQYSCRKWCFHRLCLNLFQPSPWTRLVDYVSDLFRFSSVTVEQFSALRHKVREDHVLHVPVPLPVHVVPGLLEQVEPPALLQLPQSQPVRPVQLQLLERQRDQILTTQFTWSIFKFNCKVANDINIASHLSREIESKLGGCCRNDRGLVPPPHHHEILQPQQEYHQQFSCPWPVCSFLHNL